LHDWFISEARKSQGENWSIDEEELNAWIDFYISIVEEPKANPYLISFQIVEVTSIEYQLKLVADYFERIGTLDNMAIQETEINRQFEEYLEIPNWREEGGVAIRIKIP